MRTQPLLNLLAALALLPACVTINVYFPAAAAEQAADKIINEVWGTEDEQGAPRKNARDKPPSQSSLRGGTGMRQLAAMHVLDVLISPATAAEADLNIATPAIRQLTQSMEARHSQLKQYYDSGAVGLTADALIELRDLNGVPLPQRTSVRKLVTDENADRNDLYREIAAANGHPEWEPDIRSTFAQRWVERAASGWYYNTGSGWKKKA